MNHHIENSNNQESNSPIDRYLWYIFVILGSIAIFMPNDQNSTFNTSPLPIPVPHLLKMPNTGSYFQAAIEDGRLAPIDSPDGVQLYIPVAENDVTSPLQLPEVYVVIPKNPDGNIAAGLQEVKARCQPDTITWYPESEGLSTTVDIDGDAGTIFNHKAAAEVICEVP